MSSTEISNLSLGKPVSEEDKKLAEGFKDEANILFGAKKFDEAIEKYSEAIKLNPGVPAYYSNRAFAHTKVEAYGYAIIDAESAIELDPGFAKGYYRRGFANMALAKFKESLRDFKIVAKLRPNDADAKSKLAECEKIVRRIEFEKAIRSDQQKKSVAETINLDTIVIEPSYDGALLDEEGMSEEFLLDMIERFKAQKKNP
ncbi:Palmitoyl-protein thioesterase 1 [Entomophthora muscae]|uniref:Palmitoyl-protein thioesterase 1 n=2 Tax=Entomophthora muscae TaxID=34485 RepID=A0ACC2U5T0_9FUNG|nr:Palmitoyl-protein thioesterase 1 [Entomophthora muscae]KAJ9082218.1 Palmitoyl-protein thioesterase 1 [Entomophthora muscae]